MRDGQSSVEVACREYRRRDGLTGPDWLASLGLPDYRWCGASPGRGAVELARWRVRGRWATPPMLFLRGSGGEYLSCALVVLAAAALEAWGREVPTEMRALASLALAEGVVRWEGPCGNG